MATAAEQLAEIRINHVKALYKGQSESVINAAIRGIGQMNFDTVADFEEWASDLFQSDTTREATREELDPLLEAMGLGRSQQTDYQSNYDRNIDEIMKAL